MNTRIKSGEQLPDGEIDMSSESISDMERVAEEIRKAKGTELRPLPEKARKRLNSEPEKRD